MPYLDIEGHKGVQFVRVTEATGACQCPSPAWHDQHHPQKWDRPKRRHYSAVRGTSGHDAIECYIVRTEELPKRIKKPRDKNDLKMIWDDVSKPPEKQLMKWEIQRCMINFFKWWWKAKTYYRIEVLYCELRVWSVSHKVAGTLDILATMFINGKWYLVVIDWKTSKIWQIIYKFQTSGYQGLIFEMIAQGKLRIPKIPFYDRTLVVVLGNTAPEEVWSPYDFKGFLNCVQKYRNPKAEGTQATCVYCGDYYRCKYRRKSTPPLEYVPKGAET